jgi:hypothetical protein
MIRSKRLLRLTLTFVGLGLFAFAMVLIPVSAQNVTQGYKTDRPIQKGMIVSLDDKDGSKVHAIDPTNPAAMLGVVVASSDSPVSLSGPTGEQQVFVATYGQYEILVSTQNGAVNVGDYVTVSALTGVGMKASSTQQMVIGKAVAAFDGKQGVESTYNLTTSSGQKQIQLGRIKADISVAHNPMYSTEKPQENVPQVLSSAVKLVTDRPLSPSRIYAGLAVLLLTLFLAGGILYAGVRSGMVAIGRNPLAKHSIMRNLLQVTIMALIVFVIGLFAVYLLLRL